MMGKEGKDGKVASPAISAEPFGWWDVFNGCLYHDELDAQRAQDGGNEVFPLYRAAALTAEKDAPPEGETVMESFELCRKQKKATNVPVAVASPAMTAEKDKEIERLTRECLGRDCDVCGAELPAKKWRQCAACAEKVEAELARLRDRAKTLESIVQGVLIDPYNFTEERLKAISAVLESTTPQEGK